MLRLDAVERRDTRRVVIIRRRLFNVIRLQGKGEQLFSYRNEISNGGVHTC
jgi:hypothetical protein